MKWLSYTEESEKNAENDEERVAGWREAGRKRRAVACRWEAHNEFASHNALALSLNSSRNLIFGSEHGIVERCAHPLPRVV